MVKKPLGRAVHKGGRRKGSKIDQNLPTNSFRKLMTWGRGDKENVYVVYGWSPREHRLMTSDFRVGRGVQNDPKKVGLKSPKIVGRR